jgi:hypothetical protein
VIGVAVDGAVQDVRALVEDLLRAVAVVVVDVEDGNPAGTCVAKLLGRNRGIVTPQLARSHRRTAKRDNRQLEYAHRDTHKVPTDHVDAVAVGGSEMYSSPCGETQSARLR